MKCSDNDNKKDLSNKSIILFGDGLIDLFVGTYFSAVRIITDIILNKWRSGYMLGNISGYVQIPANELVPSNMLHTMRAHSYL